MINIEEISNIKNEIENIKKFQNKINSTQNAYRICSNIDSNTCAQLNKLLSKYNKNSKKTTLTTEKTTYGDKTLDISKTGIGYTYQYAYHLNPFSNLLTSDKDGMIDKLISNKKTFEILKKNLKENGQTILTDIQKIYLETLQSPNKMTEINIPIKLSDYEKNILNVAKLYISIKDYNTGISCVLSNNCKDIYSSRFKGFDIVDYRSYSPDKFIYLIIIKNHANELNDALDKYISESKPNLEKWKLFEEKKNTALAKYLILDKIKGE